MGTPLGECICTWVVQKFPNARVQYTEGYLPTDIKLRPPPSLALSTYMYDIFVPYDLLCVFSLGSEPLPCMQGESAI